MSKKTYRVVGDAEVSGVKKTDPDPTFQAAYSEGQEQALIEGGHIKIV